MQDHRERRQKLWHMAAAVVLGLIFLSRMAKFFEPDFFMHIRIGQWIWETKSIPHSDVFSHVAFGRPWTDHEWLFQVILYGLYQLGGWLLLSLVRSLILAASYYVTLRTCRLLELPWSWSLSLTILAASMAMGSVEFRPQVITYFLFPLYLHIMLKYLMTGQAALWLLPVLMVPWANMHGAFVAVFVLAAILIAGEGLKHVAQRFQIGLAGELVPLERLVRLSAIMVVTFAVTVINPYGTEMWLFPFKVIQHPIFLQMIFEWMPPEFPFFTPYWVVLAVFFVIIVVCWQSLDFRNVFVLLAWTYLSLSARRNIVLFGYVAAPLFGQLFWQFSNYLHTRLHGKLAKLRLLPSALLYAYTVYLIYAVAQTLIHASVHEFGIGVNSTVPVRAADFIQRHKPSGEMFNEYNVGGYLIYRLFPDYKVFQDGRVDVYGPNLFYQYKVAESGSPAWRTAVNKYNINLFVLTHGGIKYPRNLASQLDDDPEWDLVYFDDLCLIYVRNSGPNRKIGTQLGYKFVKPGHQVASYLKDKDSQTSALPELDRAIREAPEARLPRILKIYCLTGLGKYDEAASATKELELIAKNKMEPLALAGRVASLRKDYTHAIELFKKALSFSPRDPDTFKYLGDAYEAMGAHEQALNAFLKAAKYTSSTDLSVYIDVARVASRLGKDRLALRYWDLYLEINPSDIIALNDAGTLCLRMGDFTRAISLLKRAVEAQPSNPAPYYNLACAYTALGDLDKALMYLRLALEYGGKTVSDIAAQDADLALLRSIPQFETLIKEAQTSESKATLMTTTTVVGTRGNDAN